MINQQTPPLINLQHVFRLTDPTGMFQHAVYSLPNLSEGYTSDDNARALIAMVKLERLGKASLPEVQGLADTYLAFLWHAFNRESLRFRNFMGYDRRWLEIKGSEDSHGRTIWSLGTVIGNSKREPLRNVASGLFELSIPIVRDFSSPRSWAFTLLGISEYRKSDPQNAEINFVAEDLAQRLLNAYLLTHGPGWSWFENIVTYSNARLSQALLLAGQWMDRQVMVQAGLESLEWLISTQKSKEGYFSPIGNKGFYPRNGPKAVYDQQPVEACAMISACITAYRLTGMEAWRNEAKSCLDWFLGANDLGLPLYDSSSGGCRDGLQPDRVNQNQGAESTLSYLLSVLEFQEMGQPMPAASTVSGSAAPADPRR